ncbi:tail tape measure protein [Sphingopyxis lindanitolerans]|uniref:Tail tape measure protein n=1 Tax=Sphingopyxis lindanitolerans TaxID=2054227 RepID=A0A2S8B7C4_9SPHN|nr:tail tape measure protein [Sphingopyxis lindanitolerans]PQM28312.1 tail tape measure protein [Sphingopyxis lindanitolerans]
MDEIDEMVVAVRADTGAFRRDVAMMRAELEGPLASGADAAGRAIERSLTRAIMTGKLGFEDLKRLALTVMADIARAAIQNGIGTAIGGGAAGGGGGLLSLGASIAGALFGAPGRATGGPVSAGRAYRVGERGPEWFVPTASGRVEAAGGAVRNIAITVNVRGDGASEPQRLAQTGRQLARAVRRAVAAGED